MFLATVIHERTTSYRAVRSVVWAGGVGYEISYVYQRLRVSIWGNVVYIYGVGF